MRGEAVAGGCLGEQYGQGIGAQAAAGADVEAGQLGTALRYCNQVLHVHQGVRKEKTSLRLSAL